MFETETESSTIPVPDELQELLDIAAERRGLDAREAALLADPAVGLACIANYGHRTAPWLAMATQLSSSAASTRVRVAQRARCHFPDLLDALDVGRIGWNHIEAFTRAANSRVRGALAELVDPLVELAEVMSFDRWCKELRGIATTLDEDGGYDPADDPAGNWLKLTPGFDGAVDLSGRLVGELALAISAIIEAETDRVAARHRADAREMGQVDETAEGEGDDWDGPSRAQCAAEALGELLQNPATSSRPELVVTYDAESSSLATDDGEQMSDSALRWLVASALIRPMEVSAEGDPLRMGRALRYASAEQRRALGRRDGGCAFPGCTRSPGACDAHHVDHWDRGGPTDVENMALLCRHHHRVTHQPGWSMRRVGVGDDEPVRFEWRTPTGRLLRSQRHQTRESTAASVEELPSSPARQTIHAIKPWKGRRIQLRRSLTRPG